MAVVTISEADLDTWLDNQPANTVDTPYELKITPLQNSDIKFILNKHPTKYVDIRETFLYSSEHLCNFKNCLTLIGAPKCQSPSSKPVFEGCTNLKYASAVSWNNLDDIFKNCTSLIDAGTVSNNRFNGTSTLHGTSMKSTFEGCKNLKTVVINDTTNALTDLTNAFKGCSSLEESPTLSTSITNLSYTFRGCSSLESAPTIPSTVTNMTGTFMACSSLASAPTIPSNVTNMGYCFYGCDLIENAPTIPSGVTNMEYCFFDCDSLTVAPNIPNGVTNLQSCFTGTPLITPPEIPNTVTNLRQCFCLCDWLEKSPIIPNSVTDMQMCFFDCKSLTHAPVIPSSVTNVEGCFADCIALVYKPIIPSTVTESTDCYYDVSQTRWGGSTSQLETFVSSQTTEFDIVEIEADTENNCYEMTGREVYGVDISNLSTWLSEHDENTTETPFEIKVIGLTTSSYVFASSLTGNPTKFVDLRYTVLPNGITSLFMLFRGCTTLVFAPTLPDTATTMEMTFDSCNNLKEAPTTPSNVENMSMAYFNCYALTVAPNIPNTVTNIVRAFVRTGISELPSLPNSITSIEGLCINCSELTTITNIPTSCTVMYEAFRNCPLLTNVPTIPNGVVNIYKAFEDCTGITQIALIPASVTNAKEAFKNCSSLRKITEFQIPLNTLKNNANFQNMFQGCTSLTEIGYVIKESSWHVWRLKFGADTVEGKVFFDENTSVNIPQTSITKSDLSLPILTDELWFPEEADVDVDLLITKMLSNKYGVFKKTVLPPDQKNFVMWADNPNNFQTNIPIAPVDVVEAGNMNPVTSNAVVPVDTVTSGNMHSVTSNAVYDKLAYRYDANFLVSAGNSETEVSIETSKPINNFNYLIFILRWSVYPYIYDTRILPTGIFATANRQVFVQNVDGARARFRYVDNTHIKCSMENAVNNPYYEVIGIL